MIEKVDAMNKALEWCTLPFLKFKGEHSGCIIGKTVYTISLQCTTNGKQ